MKVIIAGSREINKFSVVVDAIEASGWKDQITEIVQGDCHGVDSLAAAYAQANEIPCISFPAKWDDLKAPGAIIRSRNGKKYNLRAGFDRNKEMAKYAEALIAVWDGESGGTADMILEAHRRGLKVFVYIWKRRQ